MQHGPKSTKPYRGLHEQPILVGLLSSTDGRSTHTKSIQSALRPGKSERFIGTFVGVYADSIFMTKHDCFNYHDHMKVLK